MIPLPKNVWAPTIVIDEKLVISVSKLQLAHGDILVLRLSEKTSTEQANMILASFREWLRQNNFADVRLLMILGDTQLEHLDERRMQSYGWVREKGYLCQTLQ